MAGGLVTATGVSSTAAGSGSTSASNGGEPLEPADNLLDAAIQSSALSKDDVQIVLLLANTLIIAGWAYHEVMHG